MWPWLIGGLVLAGVITGLVYANRSDAAGDERELQARSDADRAQRMAEHLARPRVRGIDLLGRLRQQQARLRRRAGLPAVDERRDRGAGGDPRKG